MSVDQVLDGAFNLLLAKARQVEREHAVRPATINFQWSGGGSPLDVLRVDPIVVEVPFPSRLVWVHLYAGDGAGTPIPVVATVELRITSATSFGTSQPVYQSGAIPTLSDQSIVDVDTTDWLVNFDTGDTLIAYPLTYVGVATWLLLTLQLRPTDTPIGILSVSDNAGTDMTFNDGSDVVFRG